MFQNPLHVCALCPEYSSWNTPNSTCTTFCSSKKCRKVLRSAINGGTRRFALMASWYTWAGSLGCIGQLTCELNEHVGWQLSWVCEHVVGTVTAWHQDGLGGEGSCPWGPGREMATQNLGIGCGLEKWTWPGKWILNASQIGCYMVWMGSLHTSRLGEYNTLQMTGQGYKELVHRQLYQDLAGMQPPPKVEIQNEKRTCRPSQQGHTGSCAD